MAANPTLTPTDFVAIVNQVLELSVPFVYIEGELSNFRVSRNKWVYFDLKDDFAKVSCFGSVYMLPGPLQDGMMVKISGQPRLHHQYNFSVSVQSILPAGEGSIKKAYELLKNRLQKEGLFEPNRKRTLPYPPKTISLITSKESAAYSDFIKVAGNRWPFIKIDLYNVQVQGEDSPSQIIKSIEEANQQSKLSDVLVIIRGGGNLDDLSAFNDERVVRAIASSRIPTLVAIGHEVNELLAELAADIRASTPSNAAEMLVPDKNSELDKIIKANSYIKQLISSFILNETRYIKLQKEVLLNKLKLKIDNENYILDNYQKIVSAYNPQQILKRGYALVRQSHKIIGNASSLDKNASVEIEMYQGSFEADIKNVKINKEK